MSDEDKKTIALVTAAILTTIAEVGDKGVPSGELYAMLGDKVDVNRYTGIIEALKRADLLSGSGHLLKITSEGKIQAERLEVALKSHKENDMKTKKAAAAATTKTPTSTKTKKAHKKLLVEAISKFPARFMLKDKGKVVCMISPSESTVDTDTGEETLALVTGKGEVVANLTVKALEAALVPLSKKKDKAEGDEGTTTKKPKVKKEKKSRGENQVKMIGRLILEGKSEEEILAAFQARFDAQYGEKVDSDFVAKRCKIFAWNARKADEKVAAALDARKAEAEAAAKAAKKAAKAKKKAKAAAKADK